VNIAIQQTHCCG